MTVKKDQLQALWCEATAPRPMDADGCLDDGGLERAARGTLESAERSEVVDHLIRCSQCSQAVQVLRELEDWADDAGTSVSRSPAPASVPFLKRPATRYLALAAVLVLASGLGALWQGSAGPTTMVSRGAPQLGLAVTPTDGSLLNTAPKQLAWRTESGENLFRVTIYDAESTLVWRSDQITDSEINVPPAVRARLTRPGLYYWRVTGLREVAEHSGPLMTFEIAEIPSAP